MWLCVSSLIVTIGACMIQSAFGLSPWRTSAPIEVGSNFVAAIAFAWTLVQLRERGDAQWSRQAWTFAAIGMAILAFEDNASSLVASEQRILDTAVSAALWSVATIFLWSGLRRYAFRSNVMEFVKLGVALQVMSQVIGGIAAVGYGSEIQADRLKIINDAAELAAALAYLSALLFAEFGCVKRHGFGCVFERREDCSRPDIARGGVIDLDSYRGRHPRRAGSSTAKSDWR